MAVNDMIKSVTKHDHQHVDMISSLGRPGQQEHPDQDRQRDPTAPACNDLEQSATEKAHLIKLINVSGEKTLSKM